MYTSSIFQLQKEIQKTNVLQTKLICNIFIACISLKLSTFLTHGSHLSLSQ